MESDANITFSKKRLNIQIGFLSLISLCCVILVFLSGYVTLYADKHYDERYNARFVLLERYAADRNSDAAARLQTESETRRQLEEHTSTLKEISSDVKAIPDKIQHSHELLEEDINRHMPLKKQE